MRCKVIAFLSKFREVRPSWAVAFSISLLVIGLGYHLLLLGFSKPQVTIENSRIELVKSGEYPIRYRAIVKGRVKNCGNLTTFVGIRSQCDECYSHDGNPVNRWYGNERKTTWKRGGVTSEGYWLKDVVPGEVVAFEHQAAVMEWVFAGDEPVAPKIDLEAETGAPKDLFYYVNHFLPHEAESKPVQSSPKKSLENWRPGIISAEVEAEHIIKSNLQNPRSASFSGTRAQDLGGGRFLVTGEYEAKNAFNATVRNRFSMTLRWIGGDNWVAE